MDYAAGSDQVFRKVTTLRLLEMKKAGIKISCLTAYDALIARILDESGIDLILVGDSLGNVVQGKDTTLPVTLEETIYHTKAVVQGAKRPLVVADMPFMSFQVSPEEAFRNAGKVMKETGCSALKLEGGKLVVDAIARMTEAGIPAMGHLGLTPQSINRFGTYKARGTTKEEADQILNDAKLLEEAGAFAIVLEKIPAELGRRITESLTIPTIGIGAGPYCDGQILVYTDMLGLTIDFSPRFVRRYARLYEEIKDATLKYTEDVKNKHFPNEQESY
ncbi:MAG: 3-methyl-2-oxobutanoate hydroxymethyltransferase [Ignavibacteria bacterium GWB2_35_12]|nr:MAG: 3-methyl-2-oxobutanoate hydroxymethyltransferase [Ignavibacteria bacterium GWA2_35_8]OGU42215.1 MAG: 3-methyl-2-oxobutanoate hydroxymethyltransferase [Ignavibacteria bacterium GWB2_35_12]OGU96819.1 MAG: 3-methyl-2-oxobutanoate hydroxymethyltransferase [Ignavibacteria bacterium RIFOXYA2_FULL_35_10]OGV18819.1 MAG: 3-methyl-2-oxobutanoate hydroxymethyltransferase [Ignavibacteria bacterium RIFOXYC2_FULL_35_21]